MADNRNFAALDWLIHEIGETLKEARQALEAYVENPNDTVRIRFCLTHIHQVHGSLQMVEFFGAAMLAEEMERLTQAMIQGSVANAGEAQEVLMRAILQFPVYLDQVKSTRKDNPLVVLPLLNDLRAVRGESLLTDTKLFVPNLAPAKKVTGPRIAAAHDNVQFQAMALKLRQMYQYAAAGFIRSVNSDENLAYLQKVFNRLHKLTQGTARHALWDICLALAEALEIDAIEISVAVKNLLRQLDKEIKILAVHGTKALNSYTNDELIKNLLYYVARAGKHAPGFTPNSHLKRIYETYHLDEALIEGRESGDDSIDILSSPDPEAMRSVVEALKAELDVIKHALDVCLSGGDGQQALQDALPVVKRIADTMAVLGLGELRKQVLEQGAALEMVAHSNSQLSNEQLMSIAGKVIEIEDSLDGLAQQVSTQNSSAANEGDITLTRAKESVLRESRNGLEHAKDAIIEYIASQWDRVHLQNVPETLREIRGGLEIMPLPRAARILGACARYIEEQLLSQDFTPQWTTLDTLADAITSVEYYLERLSGGSTKEENDLLLSVAEESVAALGYPVAKTARVEVADSDFDTVRLPVKDVIQTTPEAAEADEASLAAAYETALQPEPRNLLDQIKPSIGNQYPRPETTIIVAPALAAAVEVSITARKPIVPPSEPVEQVEPVEEVELEVEAVEAESLVVAEEIPPETSEPVVPKPAYGDNDDDIDEEIIEIFVEEAKEVSETISNYFPRWVDNFADQDALTEFRRAFHTLKGSGRMVGANDIGELAWSIENMLNRILDNTIEPIYPHVAIIEKVRALLPDMIEAFGAHRENPHPTLSAHYRSLAESLAKGVVPEELLVADTGTLSTTVDDSKLAAAADDDVVHGDEEESVDDVAALSAAYEQARYDIPATQADEPDTGNDPDPATLVAFENTVTKNLALDEADDADAQLWDIFGAEALTHLQVVEEFIAHMEAEAPVYEPPSDSIQRALHTLKGSAHMAEITPIAELATPLEKFVKELRSYQVNINDDILQLLRDAVSYTQAGLNQIERGEIVDIPRLGQFVARVNELRELHVAPLVRQQELDENGKRPVDPELLSIFMAEEMNLLLDADKIIAQWQANPANVLVLQPVLDELRNLTRGAHHAYLPPMATLGEKLEQVYNHIITYQLPYREDVCATLNTAHLALLDMVDAVAAGQNLGSGPDAVYQALDQLLVSGDQPADTASDVIDPDYIEENLAAHIEGGVEDASVSTLAVDDELPEETPVAEDEAYSANIADIDEAADDTLLDVAFNGDEVGEISVIELDDHGVDDDAEEMTFESLQSIDLGDEIILDTVIVEPAANDIDAGDGAETAELPVSEVLELDLSEPAADTGFIELDEVVVDAIPVEASVDGFATALADDSVAEDAHVAVDDSEIPEPLLLDEAVDDLEAVEFVALDPDEITLVDSDEVDSNIEIVELHDAIEGDEFEVAGFEEIAPVDEPEFEAPLEAEFEELEASEDITDQINLDDYPADDADVPAQETLPGDAPEVLATSVVEVPQQAVSRHRQEPDDEDDDSDFDPEIVEIFIEEASELLEEIERALHEWQDDWNNTDYAEELKRCLHTFKGGARLAGLTDMGDLSHDFETLLIDMDGSTDIDQAFFKRLNSYQDRLHTGVEQAREKLSGEFVVADNTPDDLDEASVEYPMDVQSTHVQVDDVEMATDGFSNKPALVVDNTDKPVNQKPNVLTFAPKPKPPAAPIPKVPGSEFGGPGKGGAAQVQHLAARRAGPQEVVKVSAELLEELVNLAGETSISRSRMEQQVSDLGGAIEEMDSTIHRLQEQLRRLDIETEAQVLFRQEQMAQHEEFDPLEMDRYSQLQQLSRSLIESASDLMDLKYTLADKTRDTETLLLQQSRINTDLQEGLMRSRMVPFSRLVPRLRRIVRQAATELGKDVDFELDNVEGELDRTVLERMVAPLEHMLRNAVDHGIESPEVRAAAGKAAQGRILLSLGREGGDVMLRLADDGRGINLQRVREKAIERGLMAEDAPLSDQDLMQFILHAGFSTADKVTQISGRGVGMDVVHSEIKQLGGAMFIDSRWGEGTEFIIRLPFTVSVNRALMVQIGDDLYAIPLNTIEGIVRVSPFELEHYYQDETARFDYAGENYLVRYLGAMLDSDASPKLDGQSLPLPVILVRSTENTVALQVDRLLGSREIVVKTLGAQFSAVRGVSGATVTGDGSVVVILDLHALIREQLALGIGRSMLLEPLQSQAAAEEDLVEKTVMVVDDSVTVRKVTGRFLEREGFRVIAAKDGVEALQLLQDHVPDVMLLDIEMPRMDGFEVAKNIRTSSRLRDIPIIMITSRTGEKHRERAFELGVNKYMGKPYQEDLLLSNIRELMTKPVK